MDIEFLKNLGINEENCAAILQQNNSEIAKLNIKHTLENEFTKRGVKNLSAAMKLFDGNELTYSDGQIDGLDEKLSSFIKENDFLFDKQDTPMFSAPAGKTDNGISREEFSKMGYEKRLRLFNENPETYKELTQNN